MIKKAMILAAGFGKRIHPLTLKFPKPLLKIGNTTLLSNTLKFLELFGIKQVVINVHYLREQIADYINKNKFNLTIDIVREKNEILDTGGGVLNAIQHFANQAFLENIGFTVSIRACNSVSKRPPGGPGCGLAIPAARIPYKEWKSIVLQTQLF